jgi:predicted PurR-regulated permease PerM
MTPEIRFPFYARLAFNLLSITLIIALIYLGKNILVPIVLALLFAILLRPLVSFFNRRLKFPHVIAVIVTVALFVLFFVGIIYFVSLQIGDIAKDWEKIKGNLSLQYHNFQYWINQSFHVSYSQQENYITQATNDGFKSKNELMGNTLSTFSEILLRMVLIPFYTFLILLYRNLFIKFTSKLFHEKHQDRLQEVLFHVKVAIQSYLVGLLIEMSIVAGLTTLGLMLLGVQYALLLGVITGLLNLIPYLGILVATLLTIIAALINSTDLGIIAGVIGLNIGVHLIDNNILVPMIVGSKVRINAFVSIIGIVIGGAIAGIAGMFLAIPVIAILKVIFDRVDALEPWGFLMGDDLPKTHEWRKIKLPSFDAGSTYDTGNAVNINYTNTTEDKIN